MRVAQKIFTSVRKHFFLFFIAFILILSLRGIVGNPTSATINETRWHEAGPFELSPERGRFALALSLAENRSFSFSTPIARFATPDLGYWKGEFVSLFAPGVSFVIIPGLILGSLFNVGQVGVYTTIAFFALCNTMLVSNIARKLGASRVAATMASTAFILGTPAFAYGVSLYQHHISLFLLLCCVYILMSYRSVKSLVVVWFMIAFSLSVDYPNFFMMIPIVLYAVARCADKLIEKDKLIVRINPIFCLAVIGAVFPILLFLGSNYLSYGNPTQLAGTVQAIKSLDAAGKPQANQEGEIDLAEIQDEERDGAASRSAVGFFLTRNLLNGFYIHFFSPDRGIIFYTPVMLLGIVAFYFILKKDNMAVRLLLSIMGLNVLFYSMWGDPWGGWAFGSRYLIPTYAVLSIFLALALTRFRKKMAFLVIFYVFLSYSVAVNALGALTSSRNPPKIEVLYLEELSGMEQKYTYDRNIEYLLNQGSKSFVWRTYLQDKFSAAQYYFAIVALVLSASYGLLVRSVIYDEKTAYDTTG